MGRPRVTVASRAIARAIGHVIRRRRRASELSQEGFAELSGFHRTQVGFLERGERTPNVDTIIVAARALGIKASDLLREAGF